MILSVNGVWVCAGDDQDLRALRIARTHTEGRGNATCPAQKKTHASYKYIALSLISIF